MRLGPLHANKIINPDSTECSRRLSTSVVPKFRDKQPTLNVGYDNLFVSRGRSRQRSQPALYIYTRIDLKTLIQL